MNDPLGKCSYPCEVWPACGCGYPDDESERLVLEAWVTKAVKLGDVEKRATPWRTVTVTPTETDVSLETAFIKSRQCGMQAAWFTFLGDDDVPT